MACWLGVDTGGTFTDFLLFDDRTQSLVIHKVLSTPSAPEKAIVQGIHDLGVETEGLRLVHGSTVATNAILENRGVRTAYITSRGFGDVLAIGRQARTELYNLAPEKKPPLLDPRLCIEVDSRLDADGRALQQLDDNALAELRQALSQLAPQAVAINLLFSFLDDRDEKRIAEVLPDDVFISRSSDVLPEYREYERGMTTVLNASVGPLMQGYLNRVQQQLPGCHLSVMQSSAGTADVDYAGRYPVHLLLSGPAGGLKGAQFAASRAGIDRLLTFDMGGTSTDVSIIDGAIGLSSDGTIGGYPVAVPMVDMHTIGAGGGSMARVDAGGLLLVGPASAGADPGPACYGRGGQQATVTDANVVLGRLLPEAFLGGSMRLEVQRAQAAVGAVATALDMTTEQAAQGIIDVVNDHMVRALRVMSIQRGEDPRRYHLVCFGGAGGLHVCALAEALGMRRALVPVNAGVLSALGMLVAEPTREVSRTVNRVHNDCDVDELNALFAELLQAATRVMQDSGSSEALRVERSVDCRYRGQSYTLNIPWQTLDALESGFHAAHAERYGHRLDMPVELVNLRLRVYGRAPGFSLPHWQPGPVAEAGDTPSDTRVAGIDDRVPVLARTSLATGRTLTGPALITETTATTWLAPSWTATVDTVGNLLLSR